MMHGTAPGHLRSFIATALCAAACGSSGASTVASSGELAGRTGQGVTGTAPATEARSTGASGSTGTAGAPSTDAPSPAPTVAAGGAGAPAAGGMTPSAAAGGTGAVRGAAGAGGGAGAGRTEGGGGAQAGAGTSGASAGAPSEPANTAAQDRDPTPADFTCIRGSDWTQVGNTRYKNYLGYTDEMLAVARSKSGGVFPVGTIVQLVPTEASVKRAAGFSTASRDWEFFNLTASSSGTTIGAHGGDAKVINSFGLSCLDCHQKAAPQWDLICGSSDGPSHGCDPLPFSGEMLAGLEDARCK